VTAANQPSEGAQLAAISGPLVRHFGHILGEGTVRELV